MATNNAINLNASGIVKYDGAGTFSALSTPLSLANGGTGASSFTAYSVICGGDPSSNPLTNVASVGTSGQFLTHNGSSSLPTFQTNPGNGYWFNQQVQNGNPADATTYYMVNGDFINAFTASGMAGTRLYIPLSGTITQVYGYFTVGSAGSSESVTVDLRVNNTTNNTISSSISLVSNTTFSNSGLSISLSAGDYFETRMICPTWATNPTTVRMAISIFVHI